jgi:hypothetical protein
MDARGDQDPRENSRIRERAILELWKLFLVGLPEIITTLHLRVHVDENKSSQSSNRECGCLVTGSSGMTTIIYSEYNHNIRHKILPPMRLSYV